MKKNVKRLALGCFVIPVVSIWLLVLLMKCIGGGDEKKEDNTEKKESALAINQEKLRNMTVPERQKILAELFKYKEMGTIWSKENNFCSQDVTKKKPWNNSMTMGPNRYVCELDVWDENSMIYALGHGSSIKTVFPGIQLHEEYTFYNSTLNGVYINISDKNNDYLFEHKEDALNFLNQIYGKENIKHQLEGVNYFPSRLSFGQSNNFPFIDVAYGCKAYNTDSPGGNNYKSILSEVSPNDSGINPTKMAVVAGWEIHVDEIKNSNRCVVATIYEERKKSSNELGASEYTAVTIGLMEVNPKFPDLFD